MRSVTDSAPRGFSILRAIVWWSAVKSLATGDGDTKIPRMYDCAAQIDDIQEAL